jgi:phage-related protein
MVVEAIFYQEEGGTCPVLQFFDQLQAKDLKVANARIALLKEHGHDLRRPYAENLGRGLYELRWHVGRVQYRLLYFFHGQTTVVLAHALTKEAQISPADLKRTLKRKLLFQADPKKHTYPGEPL